jgi:hypothetical protein
MPKFVIDISMLEFWIGIPKHKLPNTKATVVKGHCQQHTSVLRTQCQTVASVSTNSGQTMLNLT